MKKIAVAVTNDISTDQRVLKTCASMKEENWEPTVIGRCLPNSLDLPKDLTCHRFKLWFNKGALFYANYNLRLLFKLLGTKCQAIWANDLDTLLACFIASKLKKVPLIFDSHEYFTEVPEIQHKPLVKKIWLTIEERIVPHIKYNITVNHSIAKLFQDKYHKTFQVVRNIPNFEGGLELAKRKEELGFDKVDLLVVLQGSGINVDRGAEELLEAVAKTENIGLMVIGGGDVLERLKDFVRINKIGNRVKFYPKMPYSQMMQYTQAADIGVTLDKNTNINYQYSLPNKLFDYIHAGIPVLASPLVEVEKVINKYKVGWILPEHSSAAIRKMLYLIVKTPEELAVLKKNCLLNRNKLDWQKEAQVIKKILAKIGE